MSVETPSLDDDRATSSDVGATAHALHVSDRRFWRRHPGDVVRLVVRSLVLALLLVLTAAFPRGMGNVSSSLIELFAELPNAARYALIGFAQILIVVIPIGILVWLYLRRSTLEALMVLGAAVAGGVIMALLTDWLVRAAPPRRSEVCRRRRSCRPIFRRPRTSPRWWPAPRRRHPSCPTSGDASPGVVFWPRCS